MKRTICLILACVLLLAGCSSSEKDWQEQYDLGMRYLEDGDYEEAILAFSAAIEIDSSRPEAYMGRAEAYIAIGEPEEALKDYKKARKAAKNNEDYEDLVEDLEEAIEELEQAIEEAENGGQDAQPSKPTVLLSSAEVYNGDTLSYSYDLAYDGQGLLSQVQSTEHTYGYGNTFAYTYDEVGRLVNVTWSEYGHDEYDYDSEGRLVRYYSVEGGAIETIYEYDDLGRLVREYSNVDSGGEEILYSYDDRGLRTSATISYVEYGGDETHSGTITYEYDEQNRLSVEITDADTYYNRTEYTYYDNAVIVDSTYDNGDSGSYGWAEVRFMDASGEEHWSLYVYHSVASVEEEDGRIAKITDAGGMVYLFAYETIGEEAEAETEKSLGLYKPLEYEIIREDRSYYDADGILRIERYYDKVVITGDRSEFATMNAAIEADMEGFFSILGDEDLSSYISILTGSDYLFHTADVAVTDNSGVVFSCRISTAWYMGGVFNADSYGLSFDVRTGQPVDLPALFGMSETELTRELKDRAWAYLSENHGDAMWETSKDTLYGYELGDFYYYFQDGELILTFPTYSLSYGAAGSFTVPTGLYYG